MIKKIGLLILFAFLTVMPVFAHPPTKIDIAVQRAQVSVTVGHPSQDPNSHFIKTITVKVNGVEGVKQSFIQQTGNEQKAVYLVPGLKAGDKVEVNAVCSKFGDLTQAKTVE